MDDRRSKNRAKWKAVVIKQEKSGQSVARFCQAQGIKVPTFQYWRKKLNVGGGAKEVGFVQLHAGRIGKGIVIRCPGGLEVELPADYSAEQAGQLIRSIRC
jgi:hypothetical protein